MSHDFLSIYGAKTLEYLLAIGYLLLFIPFWRYVQGGKRVAAVARATVATRAGAEAARPAGARVAAVACAATAVRLPPWT